MKPDKKQIPQLIVLGALVLVCIGYVSFQVMSPKDAEQLKPPAAKSEAKADVTSPDAIASVVPDGASALFPNLAVVPSRRDPFAPQRLPGADSDSQSVQAPRPRPVVRMNPMPFGKLPKLDIKPINPFGGPGLSSGIPGPPEDVPQPPKFALTGVVRGSENVAILRAGSSRYVVKQGQMIEGHYKVLLVMNDAVVLSDRGRRILVRLGGEQNAS